MEIVKLPFTIRFGNVNKEYIREYVLMETSSPKNYWYGGTIFVDSNTLENRVISLILVPVEIAEYTEHRAASGLYYATANLKQFQYWSDIEPNYLTEFVADTLYKRMLNYD